MSDAPFTRQQVEAFLGCWFVTFSIFSVVPLLLLGLISLPIEGSDLRSVTGLTKGGLERAFTDDQIQLPDYLNVSRTRAEHD